MSRQLSVYIHWPYCRSKCPYCDFFKRVEKNTPQQEIIDSYIRELNYYKTLIPNRRIRSIFFGGGTPSLIEPQYVERLIDRIFALWPAEDKPEISLEANPNSQYPNMFRDLKSAGINRLSLGVQALNEKDLRFLGRTHTLCEAYRSIDEVLKNFENHSIDLIYARPAQTPKAWLEELKQAASLGLRHLSLYQLTIEEGTVFAAKNIKPADDESAVLMYEETTAYLRQNGYPRYEVSNFAAAEFESKHNKCYWQGDEYIGIGESAHGRVQTPQGWLALTHPHRSEPLSSAERAEELILMGLRLQKGINKEKFEQLCGLNFDRFVSHKALQKLSADGYLVDTSACCTATDEGFLVLDKLIEELCSDQGEMSD